MSIFRNWKRNRLIKEKKELEVEIAGHLAEEAAMKRVGEIFPICINDRGQAQKRLEQIEEELRNMDSDLPDDRCISAGPNMGLTKEEVLQKYSKELFGVQINNMDELKEFMRKEGK